MLLILYRNIELSRKFIGSSHFTKRFLKNLHFYGKLIDSFIIYRKIINLSILEKSKKFVEGFDFLKKTVNF